MPRCRHSVGRRPGTSRCACATLLGVRIALIASPAPVPPRGWGATERVIWNIHRRGRDVGFESKIVKARSAEDVCEQCAQFNPDLVHLHAHWRLKECLPYLISRPVPLVYTTHDSRIPRRVVPDVAPSIDLSDMAIALSPSIRQGLRARGAENVRYIPNGVDTQVFRPRPKKANTVLALGRNSKRKRFAEIARFFIARPGYHLTLCGPHMRAGPGDGYPIIPTGPNITLLENQSESTVARLLGEAEYFAHICDQEASSLVVREAMACGCRVWTAPANAEDLTNVAMSWEEAVADPELGARAAREAVDSFDWSLIVHRHAHVYLKTLQRWRASPASPADARRRYEAFAAQQGSAPSRPGPVTAG